MNAASAGTGNLGGLAERLDGGFCPAAQRARPGDWEFRDQATLDEFDRETPGGPWHRGAFDAVARLRTDRLHDEGGAQGAVTTLTGVLTAHRSLIAAVLFAPGAVFGRLPRWLPHPPDGGHPRPADTWIAMCWLAEAAWEAVDAGLPAGAGYPATDTGLVRPLAARLRFLVTSEPMRARGREDPWWGGADLVYSGSGLLDRVFGDRSWGLLAARCQEARREWLRCLDSYQSQPLLAQATTAEFEAELRALVFRCHRGGLPFGVPVRPLGVSVRPLGEAAPLTAEDETIIDEVTDRHLLPRFDVLSTAALALHTGRRRGRAARVTMGAAILAGLGTVICAALLAIRPAALIGAVGCYALIGAGTVAFGPGWAAPWLLRFPAAAAVGVIALISLSLGGWVAAPPGGWLAVLALTVASLGYLMVEVRNHGVAGWAHLRRSLGVALIGAGHALLVALIGLVAIAPAFVPDGPSLTVMWQHPGYSRAGMALALATAWCLAVGVFSQVLWDDRPITAPLAHLSWRDGQGTS